jgi:hypothetical protein
MKFDLETASSEVRYFSAFEVPSPVVNHTEIVDVQWKIDFSRLSSFTESWNV